MLTSPIAFILGLIQGVGEFLPISSSAHVAMMQIFLDIPSLHRTVEISLHLGTLLAVITYFFRTFWQMLAGLVTLIFKKKLTQEAKWLGQITLATFPAIFLGLGVHTFFPNMGNSFTLVGFMSILMGILLYKTDKIADQTLTLEKLSTKHAFIIGLFQCISLIPGASRLGMTLLGARMLGYTRCDALVFSYWLSVPVVLGALTLNTHKLIKTGTFSIDFPLILGICVAFIVGLSIIHLFIKWLKNYSLGPIMIYRILFGTGLLLYVFMSF